MGRALPGDLDVTLRALLVLLSVAACSPDDYVASMEHLSCEVGETPAASRLQALREIGDRGYFVVFETPPHRSWGPESAAGMSSPVTRTVYLEPTLTDDETTQYVWHELVHVRQFHSGLGVTADWLEAREIQAQKQAAIVSAHFGLDLKPLMSGPLEHQDLLWQGIEDCGED